MAKKRNRTIVIGSAVVLLSFLSLAFVSSGGVSMIINYFDNLNFKGVQATQLNINTQELSEEEIHYIDSMTSFNVNFNSYQGDTIKIDTIVDGTNNNKEFRYNIVEGNTYEAFQSTAISMNEIINDFSAQGLDEQTLRDRVEAWTITDVDGVTELGYVGNRIGWNGFFTQRICNDLLGVEGVTGVAEFTGYGNLQNQLFATATPEVWELKRSNAITNRLTCTIEGSYDSIEVFNSNLRDLIFEYDTIDSLDFMTYNPTLEISALEYTNNQAKGYYVEYQNEILHLDNLEIISPSLVEQEVKDALNYTTGDTFYGIYQGNEIKSLALSTQDDFIVIFGYKIENLNIDMKYLSVKDGLVELNSNSFELDNFVVKKVESFTTDSFESLELSNLDELTIVNNELLNLNSMSRISNMDTIKEIKDNTLSINTYSQNLFDDLLVLTGNSTFTIDDIIYSFDDISMLRGEDISFDSEIISIHDIKFDSQEADNKAILSLDNLRVTTFTDTNIKTMSSLFDGNLTLFNAEIVENSDVSSNPLYLNGDVNEISTQNELNNIQIETEFNQGFLQFQNIETFEDEFTFNFESQASLPYENNEYNVLGYMKSSQDMQLKTTLNSEIFGDMGVLIEGDEFDFVIEDSTFKLKKIE